MRITRVETIPFDIPLRRAISYKANSRKLQKHVLVRVHADNGAVGIAEATPRPAIHGETQVSAAHIIETQLAPALVGRDPMDRAGYWAAFERTARNPTAKGALDTAVHDLIATALGIPLAALLGGVVQPVPISYMAGFGSAEELVDEALEVIATTGVRAFKVKCGETPALDIERVRRLRDAIGPDGFIFIDANEGYAPHVATRTIRAMAEYGIAMVEEPVPVHLGVLRQQMAAQMPVPLLADDSVETLSEAAHQLALGAIGVLGIKPPRSGLHNAQKLVHLAEAYAIPCWVGSQGVTGVGTLSSAHFASANARNLPFPADLGNFLRQEDDLLSVPVDLRDGKIHLPSGAGSGVQIDEEKLARYRVDGK